MAANVLPTANLNLELDCKTIHDSLGSLSHLIPYLSRLTQSQRQQLRKTYEAAYGEDLIGHLQRYEAEVSSVKSSALSLWMLNPHDRDAIISREALQQDDTNFKALVEIFVGRKSSHILLIKQAYNRRFRRNLDQDIIDLDPPHPFQKILVALTASHEAHQTETSQHISKCDARRLYGTGEGGSGAIDESVVLEILSKRSIAQLKLTFLSYKHIYGHDYTKSLKRGNSLEFEKSLILVVKCICNPASYYAKALYNSTKGGTIDTGTLVRTLISRAEIDMDEIKRVFKQKYAKELGDVIYQSIPSGDLRDFLVALATRTTHSST
ncbi:annexin A13-like [Neltuma alba]|uniref:annexin A13-like n=1 Tax=Neltuma alba TaxID=207710 RepID=UPI0010A49B08|nr:annexin A13-like [Prosopis alba]XP_028797964.1 annexin A13-like [Prosopis alba]